MYKQVWKAIGAKAEYAHCGWTVKVDADAVFFSAKVVERIQRFFGNLEVLSKTAFSILAANVDKCDKDTVSSVENTESFAAVPAARPNFQSIKKERDHGETRNTSI